MKHCKALCPLIVEESYKKKKKKFDCRKILDRTYDSSFVYYALFICIGILYPAYCSLVALQTPAKKDDSLWLIYWVVFASFNIFEAFTDVLFSWFPFYSGLKLVFLTWCSAPFTYNGAFYVYKILIEPLFRMYGGHLDVVLTQAVETAKIVADKIPDYPN